MDSQTQALIEGAKFKLEKAKVENGEITGFETVMNEGKETQTTGENGKIKFIGLKKMVYIVLQKSVQHLDIRIRKQFMLHLQKQCRILVLKQDIR